MDQTRICKSGLKCIRVMENSSLPNSNFTDLFAITRLHLLGLLTELRVLSIFCIVIYRHCYCMVCITCIVIYGLCYCMVCITCIVTYKQSSFPFVFLILCCRYFEFLPNHMTILPYQISRELFSRSFKYPGGKVSQEF